jgi:hypothetical protein
MPEPDCPGARGIDVELVSSNLNRSIPTNTCT